MLLHHAAARWLARKLILQHYAHAARRYGHRAAEAGVYQGDTAQILDRIFPMIDLFDTWEGIPEYAITPGVDLHQPGDFSATEAEIRQRCPHSFLHKGKFKEVFGRVRPDVRWSFVHIDCDTYISIRECLEFFWPRLEGGGILVVDDYGAPSCPGARIAVNEFKFVGGGHMTQPWPWTEQLVVMKTEGK